MLCLSHGPLFLDEIIREFTDLRWVAILSWHCVFPQRALRVVYVLIHLISAPLTNIREAWLGKKGISYLPFPTPGGPRRTCRSLLLKWGHGCLPLRLHSTRTFCHLHPGLTFIWDKHPNWGTTSPPFFYVEHQASFPSWGFRISRLASPTALWFLAPAYFPIGQSQDHRCLWHCGVFTLQIHTFWGPLRIPTHSWLALGMGESTQTLQLSALPGSCS